MKLPLMTTFLPQITISLVLGVVSIVIFSNMHHDAIDESMRNSLRGSMIYSESRIGGPFEVAKSDAGRLIESARLHNAFIFRGNDNRIYPALSGNTATDAVALQGLLAHFQDISIAMNFSKGVYSYISQMYRIGRKTGTSPTSTNPLDFDWHWSGVNTAYYYHPINVTTQAFFNNNRQYPRYTSSDVYFVEEHGYSITGIWWTPANSSTGYFGDIYTWVQTGTGKFEILMPVVVPMTYDPTTGYITSLMEIDVDCNSWMTAFLEELDIPGTELTIINPKSSQVMSSSFPALAPGYNVKNASDPTQSVLWGLYDTPEPRLTSAMKRVEALGFALGSLPYETKILEDPNEKDIVTVRPVRQAGANLLMVAVTERDHYFGEGERTQRDAIIICTFLLLAGLIVAVLTAILLSRPLSDLGNRMALTASLQDDDTELQPSMVSEISEMQGSYSAMKVELTRVKSFLPQSVLAGNMGDEDEDEEGDVPESTENERSSRVSSRSRNSGTANASSRHSSNESSRRSGGAVVGAALNLAANAVSKRVTVAMFNLKGFNERVRSGDNNSILRLQNEFLELVLTKSRDQRGVLDVFNGDHVTITWNAVTNVASAGRRAVGVAYDVCRVATQNSRMPSVSVGVSQGQALVGNSGTSDAKRFNVMGVVYSAAAKLERMASTQLTDQTRRVILMSQSMLMEVEHEYFVKCIDVARFANGSTPTVIATLLGPKVTTSDEWMYELREGEAADNNRLINAAFHLLAKGDTAGFEEALARVPEVDRQTLLEAKEKMETTKS